MSDTSLSPTIYHELRHVKQIRPIPKEGEQRKRTVLYQNKEMLEREFTKCNQSCECSECGNLNSFFSTIKRQFPLKETKYMKRRRILKRFKAAGNAILFILTYKMDAIKKFRKRMHILRAVRNLTTIRKNPIHIHPQQQIVLLPLPQSKESSRTKTVPDEEFLSHFTQVVYPHRKSHVSQFMEQMLKETIPKRKSDQLNLQPLKQLDIKIKKTLRQSLIKPPRTASNVNFYQQIQPLPFIELNRTQNINSYNNKDLQKQIDSMKIKHRVIKTKK